MLQASLSTAQETFMRPRLFVPVLICALLGSAFACSETTTSAPPPTSTPEEAGTEPDAGETTTTLDAATTPDAARDLEEARVDGLLEASCAETCAAASYTCAVACEYASTEKLAGRVRYSGSVGSTKFFELETCDDVAPATLSGGFTPSSGRPVSCCCMAPGRLRVEGDAESPKSCDEICADHGATCDDTTTWGDVRGGSFVRYTCGTSALTTTRSCATTLDTTTEIAGAGQCALQSFRCGCL